MKSCFISFTIILATLLAACSGGGKAAGSQFGFMDSVGISIDKDLLLGDTLTLHDIYCSDPSQRDAGIQGKRINHDQYLALIVPAGDVFHDEMGSWRLLGVRDMGDGITLAAYYDGSGLGYSVDLITYDRQGHALDAINARELHLLWRCDPSNIQDNSVFTLDGFLTFDAAGTMTLHRTMGMCMMDFEDDLKGDPQWQQQWEQTYVIDAKGQFVLQGQQVVKQQGQVDNYAAMDFRTWDMLVCSLHDPAIMDTWNEYCNVVESSYDPEYEYSPFPLDVNELYKMNPQRFLSWLSMPANRNCRLLKYFKLRKKDHPAMLREVASIADADARQWLTALVGSWDDKPLTKHL